jgi:hypothetical protein
MLAARALHYWALVALEKLDICGHDIGDWSAHPEQVLNVDVLNGKASVTRKLIQQFCNVIIELGLGGFGLLDFHGLVV